MAHLHINILTDQYFQKGENIAEKKNTKNKWKKISIKWRGRKNTYEKELVNKNGQKKTE